VAPILKKYLKGKWKGKRRLDSLVNTDWSAKIYGNITHRPPE